MQAEVSKKQAALREAAAAEETPAELKSQVETVFNKKEMIDVIGCTKSHAATRELLPVWSCTRLPRKTHLSGRMRILERGIQPAFSGKMPRAGQSGFHHRDHAGRSQRSATDWSSDAGASRWRNNPSEAQLWSETEKRGHLLKELGSLRDQRAQIST